MNTNQSSSDHFHSLSSPTFNSWLSKCQSAVQPCPIRPELRRTKRIQELFPIHSSLDSGEGQKEGQKSNSGSWGWFGRTVKNANKDEEVKQSKRNSSSPSILRPSDTVPYAEARQLGDKGESGIFDELEALLDPVDETVEDRAQKARCEKYLDNLFHRSPMVRFMAKHLNIVGCSPFDEDGKMDKIFLTKCQNMKGGFMPSPENEPKHRSGLLVCYNVVYSQSEMEGILAHEMMHWFDHCRFKVDWSNLRHAACSEIRASSLSGECRLWSEFQRGQGGFRKHHQKCARRRAILSLSNNPECPDKETAERIVDEVFESCINDTRPFDEIY